MKLSHGQTAVLTRRLADLVAGGVTVPKSVEVLRRQTAHPPSRALLDKIQLDLESGRRLSEALDALDVFPPLCVGMVSAGEYSGRLDASLQDAARLMEADVELRQKIAAALAYPALVLALSAAVCVFLTTFVIPRFQFLFDDLGQRLPLPTRLLLGASESLRNGAAAALAAGAGYALYRWRGRARERRSLLPALLRLPGARRWAKAVCTDRWARAVASLLRGGFTVSDALHLSRHVTGAPALEDAIDRAGGKLFAGESLSDAVREIPFLVEVAPEMIAAGEESGRLEESLLRLADAARRDAETALKTGLSLLEPALILLVGLAVGFVALAMVLPIFDMSAGLR